MSPTMARLSAILTVFLIAATALVLVVTANPPRSGTTVKAEFQDAFPILAGMNVRVNGAVAGTVRDVEVTDSGTALVDMELSAGTSEPRSDAIASIRQQDITGDSYVSLSLGEAPEELGGETIPIERTLVAPRFDDLLNSFAEPERQALRLILVEAGKALEGRGDDLNAAILKLRPALEATNDAVGELASQNQALGQIVEDAEQVTGQTAERSDELAGMIDSLAATLDTTASHSDAVDESLAKLPATAHQAKETLTRLRRTAVAATPLARTIGRGAPELASILKRSPGFVRDARRTLRAAGPTIVLTTNLLRDAGPTLEANPKKALTAPLELAGSVDELLKVLLGNEPVLKTLFGADAYGEGPGRFDDVGLPAMAVEGGTQTGYPGNDPERRFLRAVLIPSCEAFGFRIEPGCLTDAINQMSAMQRRQAKQGGVKAPDETTPNAPGAQAPNAPAAPEAPATPEGKPIVPALPRLPLPGQQPQQQVPKNGVTGLLDFLLKP